MALLATILFFVVFVQLFIVLSISLWKTIYDYIQAGKAKKHSPDTLEENIKLHISGGLLEVNRLPDEQGKEEKP